MTLFDDHDPIAEERIVACKSCAKPIRWIRTQERDKPMPVDARRISVMVPTQSRRSGTPVAKQQWGYTSHFATCPDAAEHRK